jgi:hypothetical protein
MMSLNKTFMVLIINLIFSNAVNAATVYKWIDKDGQVHYGGKATNKKAEKIEIKNKYIDSGNTTAPLSAEERVNDEKKFLNALDAENKSISEKKKKQEQEEAKITRCNASRDQLRRYENSGALYDLDEKGNRILLNKKQYEQAMGQARARVEKWCD